VPGGIISPSPVSTEVWAKYQRTQTQTVIWLTWLFIYGIINDPENSSRSLSRELSSTARALGSRVRIPVRGMEVCVPFLRAVFILSTYRLCDR
jgi:hypothetical protein